MSRKGPAGPPSSTSTPSAARFSDEIVAAVKKHMNDDHTADSLIICRGLADLGDAVGALVTDIDTEAVTFAASLPDGFATARVPWGRTVTERAEIRVAVVELYERACAALS